MSYSLTSFKSTLAGGGSRPNLFEVSITAPSGITIPTNHTILCKAANLPASNVASIDVPFRGRTFKVAGDRTFDPWTITVINDQGHAIRRAMEDWMQLIAQLEDGSGKMNPSDYMSSAIVTQLKRKSSTLTSTAGDGLEKDVAYKFNDIFPTNVSAIDLSYDSSDTIEEFTVEFQVNYWAHA